MSSIGNYKGVMLCNRPFAGVSAAARKAYNNRDSKPPFVSSGNKQERLGLNPIRNKITIKRSKKNTAISKHKKWIRDQEQARRDAKEQQDQEEMEKKQKREEFYERQRQHRVKKLKIVEEEREAEEAAERAHQPESQSPKNKKKKGPKKPRWAMTKEAAKKASEIEEEEEFEKLLDFANGLDFEQFIDDLEVRAALAVMKDRVDDLVAKENEEEAQREAEGVEAEEKYADSDDEDVDERELRADGAAVAGMNMFHPRVDMREEKAEDGGWNSSVKLRKRDDDDARSIASARSILSTASMKSLKQVHSAKSIAKLAESIKVSEEKQDDRTE